MSSIAHHQSHENSSQSNGRRLGRGTIAWLLAAVLLTGAIFGIGYARSKGTTAVPGSPARPAQTYMASMLPADQFMRSVVIDDGALGWRQLCPSVQARLPLDALVQQANAERAAAAQQGIWLTMEIMGTQPRDSGGKIHNYRLTAHWPNGATEQRTFSVFTQPSGCVEDVQSQSVQTQ